ncbi:hypothetical protein SAMD00019534_075820 [Acytostelium subglobosum LB1]|uniref:hypothetical protein n=1 Tax=Acytostelium subglobosum LB1 TaxID=1410327 RepID=UPI000644CD77|nr:hypothetical protein SAMD00019534_075820 [Acytostelium subglobosum LB1]GAM24407.1 hypothetical protein SAMD00019534_075820 [Acytostelium subglobosum LB1]|eukprot:XP_012752733.1 hypothetical protein SAMD00019534_075820 [Acytostelium subglobosum LB1]
MSFKGFGWSDKDNNNDPTLNNNNQQQQSSSMFDYNDNNYTGSIWGTTTTSANNNNDHMPSHINDDIDDDDFDINMLPDDEINFSSILNSSMRSPLTTGTASRSMFATQQQQQTDLATPTGLEDIDVNTNNEQLENFRLMTQNKTDDHILYDIVEGQVTRNQLDYMSIAMELRSYCASKLALLNHELESHYFLPNKKETERLAALYQKEKDTWEILCRLYQDRDVDYPKEMDQEDITMDTEASTQVDVVNMIIKKDYYMRENIIVLNWLEEMASTIKYSDEPVCWSKTLERLRMGNQSSGLIKQLDPDAPQRTNLKLDLTDQKDDNQFLATLWSIIRSGNRELAVQFCAHVGQHWRAQTLIGDAKFAGEMEVGNPFRNLWRSTCLQLSNNTHNEHERAIYGLLAGNIGNALVACKDWNDYLWTYTRVLIDEKLNEMLRSIPTPPTSEEDAAAIPASLSTNYTAKDLLHILRTNSPTEIMNQSIEPYHIIQDRVISNDYQTLLQSLIELIKTGKQTPEFLRLAVSLILFYRFRAPNYQVIEDEKAPENIIIYSYISHLIDTQRNDLVALYTSFLGSNVQRIKIYSKFLEGITEQEERQTCLKQAEKFKLDTDVITQTVVNNITAQNRGVSARSSSSTTPADVAKIDAIAWLCFNPQQRIEAVFKSNLLIREFVSDGKSDAAQQLLDALPKNTVAISQAESTRSESETVDILKEFTNWAQYLEATRRIGLWAHNYSKRPKQTTLYFRLTGKESYAQKLDLERRKKEIEEEYGQWNQNNMMYGKDAIESTFKILKQTWLCPEHAQDGVFENPDENERQIHALRVHCIPALFFSLHQVLVGTGHIKKSSKLCNLLADERFKWYNVFSQEQLQEMLILAQTSLVAMMDDSTRQQRQQRQDEHHHHGQQYDNVDTTMHGGGRTFYSSQPVHSQ